MKSSLERTAMDAENRVDSLLCQGKVSPVDVICGMRSNGSLNRTTESTTSWPAWGHDSRSVSPALGLPGTRLPPTRARPSFTRAGEHLAGVIQLVECQLPKLDVVGSSPIARST